MAQTIVINGATYPDVPGLSVPRSGGGSAYFMDPSELFYNNAGAHSSLVARNETGEVEKRKDDKQSGEQNRYQRGNREIDRENIIEPVLFVLSEVLAAQNSRAARHHSRKSGKQHIKGAV